jgi:hypothetical protein
MSRSLESAHRRAAGGRATECGSPNAYVEEAPEGGLTARALGESIFTEGDSMDELRANVKDAVLCHFDEGKGPKTIRLHFVRDEVLTV